MVEKVYNCPSYGKNGCIDVLTKNASELIRFYFIFGAALFLIDFVVFVLIKVSQTVQVYQQPKPLPRIQRNERVGFGTASLRAKRIIEPALSPYSSLTELNSTIGTIVESLVVNENDT